MVIRTMRTLILSALLSTLVSAGCGEDKARVRFFLDVNSKAPEPGYEVQYTFVVWNEGRVAALDVALPVSLRQTEPYEHLTHVSYVRGSMSINHEYHPDTSHESYYFVTRTPLTDAAGDDEGRYDEGSDTLFFTMEKMEPDDYVIWAFNVIIDEDAVCEENTLMQNWVTVSADNSAPYSNDIIGHIVCRSPKLRVEKTCDALEAGAGARITYTLHYSYDETVVEGVNESRFDLRRVRMYDSFPREHLEILSVGGGGRDQDGTIFWQIDKLENGGSGSVSWTAGIKDDTPAGAEIINRAEITSQNTVNEQNMGGSCTVTVTAP
jgi:hypothetical protein